MEHPQGRKSSKDDSVDLEARARVTFAATADEPQEYEVSLRENEGLSNEDIHKYLDKAIIEANKKKSNPSRVHKKMKFKTDLKE